MPRRRPAAVALRSSRGSGPVSCTLAEVLRTAETDDVIAHAKVVDVLKALPRVGAVRAEPRDGAARHRTQPPAARPRPAPGGRAGDRVRPASQVTSPSDAAAPDGRLRSDGGGQGHRGRRAAPAASRGVRLGLGHDPAATSRRDRRGALPLRHRGRVRPAGRHRRAAGVGGRARPAPLRHPESPGAGRPRGGPRSGAGDRPARAPARSESAGRTLTWCSWPRRPGRSWSADSSAEAPSRRPSGPAGWTPPPGSWPPRASSTAPSSTAMSIRLWRTW